ncbi:MAG: glucose 1-dehydrogenase [Sphingomicrobium sp.]
MGSPARVVAITGAASGIGLACARRFAAAGDRVVLIDHDGDRAEARAVELGQIAIQADVADEAQLVACFATIQQRFGRLDVLVNNAGIIDAGATAATDIDLADYHRLFAVNVDGLFVAAREAARIMVPAGAGAIVNLASVAGVVAVPYRTAYSATKAAILGLTRGLACEWAPSGIRVNAVLPGYVATDIVKALVERGKVDLTDVERRVPLGRLAEPGEIANAIHYLCSPGASFTVGAEMVVDGGYQAFGGTGPASSAVAPEARPGRVALVTGAASGIGTAIARRLADDGYRLLLFDRAERRLAEVLNTLGERHAMVVGDVRSEEDAAEAVRVAEAHLGPVDTLINNVGVADAFRPTLDQSLDEFRRGVEVNLTSALIMARAVAPGMIAGGGGGIVNIASIAGLLGLPRRNAYGAAKAGLIMMTRSLACEWAEHGIRVNAVAPGYIATPGVAALEQSGKRDLSEIRRRTPLGRLGEPAEIAHAVAFLASQDASYITGSTLSVDGGWAAYGDVGPAS